MNDETKKDPWDQVVRRGGIPEVTVEWVHENGQDMKLIDVRQPEELRGPLGYANGVQNVPLGIIGGVCLTWDKNAEYVLICRSGGRSAQATHYMESQGFSRVVNMTGGMLTWNERGLPTK